ncbi:ULP-PROTEASE domain-containing protein [Mycena chlorophos]|uniref:ULP-PROTEASE domain-containing protein n=1 Tax=Mycena chlorophos TaxID=658473 RepID=A0A8H6WND1_MYCCL|nr:ULP-PROTEASE domain-containing protein [Mycena chlorophos]
MDASASDAALSIFNATDLRIRGMQLKSDDFVPMQDGRKLKVPGTAMNAVGALIQQVAERDGDTSFAIFSSWLGPLVSRQVAQGSIYGTIRSHIDDACNGASLEMLSAKSRWIFPMYGSDPPHWVLGWIEPGSRTYHIFNSMPELSSTWIEPALLELGDTVYATLGVFRVDWESWRLVSHSPPELQRQTNDWSCGFFVIHAMNALVDGVDLSSVTNRETGHIKKRTLSLILDNIPLFQALPTTRRKSGTQPTRNAAATDRSAPNSTVASAENEVEMSGNEPDAAVDVPMAIDPPTAELSTSEPAEQLSSKRKMPPTKAPKAKRTRYTKPSDREKALRENQWTAEVEPHRVRCNACRSWIKLDETAKFKPNNWERHERDCSQITGVKIVRTGVVKNPKPVVVKKTGKSSIFGYFAKAPKPAANGASTIDTVMASGAPTTTPPSGSRNKTPSSDSETENETTVTYATKIVQSTRSISHYFHVELPTHRVDADQSEPQINAVNKREQPQRSCQHLSGSTYTEYIERTETRLMGGISPTLLGRVARQTFPYKKFVPLKSESSSGGGNSEEVIAVPPDGNASVPSSDWTSAEHLKLESELKGYARWTVNYARGFVAATQCEGLTSNQDGVCDECRRVANDESFKHAVNLKNREANLSMDEQHDILLARNKFSSRRFSDVSARDLDDKLKDPLVFTAFKMLQKGESTECFIHLYEACRSGKLKTHETFKQLCVVLADSLEREGTNRKFGIRYPQDYLNFTILMRSYGGQSAKQYAILSGQLPAPSSRHLRALVSKSEDALQNPNLIYENIARVKRLADRIQYSGPVCVAGDCTKVRERLTYSNDFGGHILGSVLPLDQCIVEDPAEIEALVAKIAKSKSGATQVRAIMVKLPVPHVPPQVVALLPTNGKDDAPKILEQHLKLLQMAAELDLPVISFAADGAASELLTQNYA